ncbi:BTB/POZ protein, partial [Blyttiomyces helicus]
MNDRTSPALEEATRALELQVTNLEAASASSERQGAVARSELIKFADLTSKAMHVEDSKAVSKARELCRGARDIAAASLSLADRAREELNRVKKERKELEAYRLQLEKIREQMAVLERKQTTKVKLNVGGYHFETSVDTLRSAGDSFFTCLFDGKWIANPDESDGSIFIDRDGRNFHHILNHLRDGSKAILPADAETLKNIANEADFFGLLDLAILARGKGGVFSFASFVLVMHSTARSICFGRSVRFALCGVVVGPAVKRRFRVVADTRVYLPPLAASSRSVP